MKIAIVGAGISGNTIAHLLHKEHKITVSTKITILAGTPIPFQWLMKRQVLLLLSIQDLLSITNQTTQI